MKKIIENAATIDKDINWLHKIIEYRINSYVEDKEFEKPEIQNIENLNSYYGEFVTNHNLTKEERIVLLLALLPEVKPEILNVFSQKILQKNNSFPEFGGINSTTFNGFLPSIKTALFILGGSDLKDQMKYQNLFDKKSKLFLKNILIESKLDDNLPPSHRHLCLSDSAISYITTGKDVNYEFSSEFPASLLSTELEWQDLILCEETKESLKELLVWIDHGSKLTAEKEMRKHFKPGFRALFEGMSGTGKTLTASLIGKKANKPVYRIDLSQIVSKYIGETEKNLEKIFNLAEKRDWILFFDEADALFGKRSDITTSNDRYANQETAYLLQRIENCKNLIILATNLKKNFDDAFTRRFQSIVNFPLPEKNERERLWQTIYPKSIELDNKIDIKEIAQKYDIAGGTIANVVRYSTMMALSRNEKTVTFEDLQEGLKQEYSKMGYSFAHIK